MWLLADIGGTHSRLCLAHETGLIAPSLRHCENDRFADADALFAAYLAARGAAPTAAAIAMAGPVAADPPRLTNRDWTLSPDTLAPRLGCRPLLLNDLEALALSLPSHPASRLLVPAPETRPNGRRLAVGIGTGMNACPLQGTTPHPLEYGHRPLPKELQNALPGAVTIEDLFSGRGYARFCESGVVRDYIRDYSALIGTLCALLANAFSPRDGISLAGGVARSVLTAAPAAFAESYHAHFAPQDPIPPVSLILSDDAALLGCHAALSQTQRVARG